jgi:plastocyanin
MRCPAVVLCVVVLATGAWSPPNADAVSRRKECRLSCTAAIDACVATGGKRRRCKRQILRQCRREGVPTCMVTTTTTTSADVTTTAAPGTTTTTTLPAINGCTSADVIDRRAPTADRTVEFADFAYLPRCIRIRAGQSVTFSGIFASHPLVGGEVAGGVKTPDPTSPIPSVDTGELQDVPFAAAGTFPYYCDNNAVDHAMAGVVFVDP